MVFAKREIFTGCHFDKNGSFYSVFLRYGDLLYEEDCVYRTPAPLIGRVSVDGTTREKGRGQGIVASGIKLNSNIASLSAQRHLSDAAKSLQQSYARLSSGLRINKAGDDAAGLAVADGLKLDSVIYRQAIRNVNDALSPLSIAEGALQQLQSISQRQVELATQAANGVYSTEQRQALNTEANALVEEFNRIVASTEFNGISLFGEGPLELRIQAGSGVQNSLAMNLGAELSRIAGEGTFTLHGTAAAGSGVRCLQLSDLNADGVLDLITSDYSDNTVSVAFGNGDGTFGSRTTYATGVNPRELVVADLNGDGAPDMATADKGSDQVSLFFNQGDGTFAAAATLAAGDLVTGLAAGDLNNDGHTDLVTAEGGTDGLTVFWGSGNGAFSSSTFVSAGHGPVYVSLGDINDDGRLDMVTADWGDDTASVLIQNSDGTFTAQAALATGVEPGCVKLGDLDRDGHLDLVVAGGNSNIVSVFNGRGDGSFEAGETLATGGLPVNLTLEDVNDDGVLDLLTADFNSSQVSLFMGRSDGSFESAEEISAGTNARCIAFGDLNGDGVPDMAVANTGDNDVSIFQSSTRQTASTPYLNIATREGALAALDTLDDAVSRISAELSQVGSLQSRFSFTLTNLQSMWENCLSAESRIRDADIAEETAGLVRNQILQQAAVAILAQANQQPSLVLTLLGG